MTEDQGTIAEPVAEVVTTEDAPDVQEQATAPGNDQDDALFEAMEAEQFGAEIVEETPTAESETMQVADVAPDLHEATEEPTDAQGNLIDPDTKYVFRDADGNDYEVLGKDAIYQTTGYHRKMQELHDSVAQYQPLEQMFEHQKGELAKKVLLAADPAERLDTVGQILQEAGLSDLAESLRDRMAASNLEHDPLQAQQAQLERQRQELSTEKQRLAAQQALQADQKALETNLGRPITAREWGGINNVFQNWMNARQANPGLARPSMETAYRMAQDAMKFEDSQRQPSKNKPASALPRVSTRSTASSVETDDEVFAKAMSEQGIAL